MARVEDHLERGPHNKYIPYHNGIVPEMVPELWLKLSLGAI